MRITINDVRAAGHCVAGARDWFTSYGLDFRDFIKNGIDADVIAEINDAYGNQVIERKLERESDGRKQ
jgi:hypothetical protein